MNDSSPDYVVVGETRTYSLERIEKAVQLVFNGAKLIGTNPDMTGPTEHGIVPATGAADLSDRAGYAPQGILRRPSPTR